MSGEKILVIDDRRENLLFLANSVLRPEGYEVITAMDGREGLEKALTEKPNLIITDLKMPRMSGLELMAALRKENLNTAVILTTFYGSEQAAIEAFRLGAKDYIIKPYEIKDMLESVERALVEQRLRRETQDLQEGVEISRHLEERVRQLHSLCSIGKAVTALQDLEEVMRLLVEASIYLTDAGCGQLFLVDAETKQLELRAVRGPSDSRATCMRHAGADPITQQVVQTGKALFAERNSTGRDKVPCLVVPLRTKDQIVGALGVDGKSAHAFNENDRYLMGILADFAVVALTNAEVIEDLKKQLTASLQQPGAASGGQAGAAPALDLTGSIAEAEQLSRELRNLAAAAQVLAAKLQVIGGSG
jgi:two-component system NtrC family sensor kinase